MTEKYAGRCAGGPLNGRDMAAQMPIVRIPIKTGGITLDPTGGAESQPCRVEIYKWSPDIKMWIWQAEWPPKERPVT